MKAARLNEPGGPLVIEEVPDPEVLPGGVKVRVERAAVPSFAAAVFSGALPIPLPVPYTPGPSCVGVVESTANDVIGVSPGARVFCSPYHKSIVNGGDTEEILIGWFGMTPGSGPLMARWKNGAFAEKAVYPAGCVTAIDSDGAADDWIGLAPLAIAYGGLLRCELPAGGTLMVNGATGNLGAAAVLTALAFGVERVYAVGRNEAVLERLRGLDPRRVVPITVDTEEGYAARLAASAGPVDALLDALGYVQSPLPTVAGIPLVKTGGSVVFMGGVFADIPISYFQMLAKSLTVRGSFMHPQNVPATLVSMVRGGVLDLKKMSVLSMPLHQVNEALKKAPQQRGLDYCCIAP